MALISPGTQITVTDQSQYVSSAVGTVPLMILATAENKTANGVLASGTTAENAGKLQVFTSQRDLVTALGYPVFKQSSAGTPLHGNELNEYGLMAAYSALGISNRLYAIRANIDLNELVGTAVRPTGEVADGTYWLDLAKTTWGIFEWSSASQSFTNYAPLVIDSATDTTVVASIDSLVNEPAPKQSIGAIGSYAVVATTNNNRIFVKAGLKLGSLDPQQLKNTWVLVGSTAWQQSMPTVTGSVANPTIVTGSSITINGTSVTVAGTTASAVAAAINTAAITGVYADVFNSQLAIYADSTSSSTGTTADGKIAIAAGAITTAVGLTAGTFIVPAIQYSNFAGVPLWNSNDPFPAPSGSVWFKTGAVGGGSNFVINKYSAATGAWTAQSSQAYKDEPTAIYNMDIAGGSNIAQGAVFIRTDPSPYGIDPLGLAGFRPVVRKVYGEVVTIGNVPTGTFTNGSSFTLKATQPGTAAVTSVTVTVNGTTAQDFVTAVLSMNIPYVTAAVASNGAIILTHKAGGTIALETINAQPNVPAQAGFVSGVTNVTVLGSMTVLSGSSFLEYTYGTVTPHANPIDGTLWYNSDATTVDIMVNTGSQWKGYQNVSADARGYNLSNTDPAGVIVSATKPISQSDNSSLVAGDLWLDTSDLENWPKLSRFNGSSWVAIDNTDHITQNGIIFADARWDTTGTTDPVNDNEIDTSLMLISDYVDLDAPNPELYPRGTLLFNMRRSGYNVKRFESNYFNTTDFDVNTWVGTSSYNLGDKVLYGTTIYVAIAAVSANESAPGSNVKWAVMSTGTWVTSSGLDNNGVMYAGSRSQRQMVVAAMKAAIDNNSQIREDQFQFNLVVAAGYPEVIPNMVSLNNDRANTAFVIGDTPMTLSTNAVAIANWSSNSDGKGLSVADPYLAVYYPSALSNDLNGNTIMVPPSHMALYTYLYNDNVSYPWFAPAGTHRGLVSNATDLGYLDPTTGSFVRSGIPQGLRDALYEQKINPITIMNGTGIVVWGQKTRDPVNESMDRVNVSRLVNYVRTIMGTIGNGFLFEPNDKITRDQLKHAIDSALSDLVAKRGIYEFSVVCDTTNNTPDVIANNELVVDIAFSATRASEYIYIPIRLVNPGTLNTTA